MFKLFHKLITFFDTFVENSHLANEKEKLRFFHFLWLSALGIFSSIPFIAYNLIAKNYTISFLVFIFIGSLVFSFFLAKRKINTAILYNILNIIFLVLVLFFIYFENEIEMRILWCYIYPISSIFLFGNKKGLIWSIAMLAGALLSLLFAPHNPELYTPIFIARFCITYITVTCIASWLEFYRELYHTRAIQSVDNLKKEHELLEKEIQERKNLQDKLSTMAHTDCLTNLLNRRHFWELGTKELTRANRYNFSACLAVLDIDNFKNINDTCGHPAGDEVLRIISRHCSYVLRESDLLGRIGGEEFAFLLTHVDIGEACAKLENLRKEIENLELSISNNKIDITVSIGVCKYTKGIASIDELYKKADNALYEAKKEGKNRVSACTS